MNKSFFAHKIVEWYGFHHRPLPWRETRDPYKIWISEIILQQTRVAQGLPYYLKFVQHFPDVQSLAEAPERQVLRLWQGLGYYSRARNMHHCARTIVRDYGGKFPDDYAALLELKGIGPYTAAAIASFAFREAVAAVDGNVYRVLSRLFGIEEETTSSEGKFVFSRLANELLDADRPDLFNQAVMEFGALQCVPRNPVCEECIFQKQCVAFSISGQSRLPVKKQKAKVRKRYFTYFVLEYKKKWLMRKRLGKDIWRGLFDFYLVETGSAIGPLSVFRKDPLLRKLGGEVQQKRISSVFRHLLSHQHLHARFVPVKLPASKETGALIKAERLTFYSVKEIGRLPKPVLVSRYLSERDIS